MLLISEMNITQNQRMILDNLHCVRISNRPNAIRLVEDFHNPQNEVLVDYIKGDAFEEDASGKAACYIILDSDEDILCYFALKSGLLYDEFHEWREYEKYKKINNILKDRIAKTDSKEAKILLTENEKKLQKAQDNLKKIIGIIEAFPLHKQVDRSYSAIELSHFCVNENCRKKWEKYGFDDRNRMGITLFWNFIIEKVIQVSELVGCEYLYLFAADSTPDHFLVNHYKGFMGFREDLKVLSLQPKFDFRCTFLCNTIEAFKVGKDSFFAHFNDADLA